MGDDSKKDLTSLVELSALELQKNPQAAADADHNLTQAPIEKITEEDFGNLEELSKMAAEGASHEAPPPEAASPPPAPLAEAPPLSETPAIASLETGPGESPLGAAPPATDPAAAAAADMSVPSFMDGQTAAPAVPAEGAPPPSFDLPSFSQIGTGESPAIAPTGELAVGAPPTNAVEPSAPAAVEATMAPAMAINEGFPQSPQGVPQSTATESVGESTRAVTKTTKPSTPPPPTPKTVLDPNRQPTKGAPAGSSHTVKGVTPATGLHDLSDLKKFAEKISIGKPAIEGAPAFSLLIRTESNHFDEKTIKAIQDAVTSEDFGIRLEDVAIQLSAGKLLVPQVSEFAAVTLAQKLHDVVDNIEVDLAGEIFKSTASEVFDTDDAMLLDTEEFESHHEEVHDMGAEPRSADDLFSTNLSELKEFQVTRILSLVMASEVVAATIAENPAGKEFEGVIEKLTGEVIARAFKLGAHGVLGLSFTLRSIDAYRDPEGKIKRAYRLLGNGTAVRVRRRPNAGPSEGATTGGSSIGSVASGSSGDSGGEPPAEPGK